jgi:hypothetical protein
MGALLQAALWLIIFGILYFIIDWGLKRIGLPDPFNRVLNGILVFAVVFCAINVVLFVIGHPFFSLPKLSF